MKNIEPYKTKQERKVIYEKLLQDVDEYYTNGSVRFRRLCAKLTLIVTGNIEDSDEAFYYFPEYKIANKKFSKPNQTVIAHENRAKTLQYCIELCDNKIKHEQN